MAIEERWADNRGVGLHYLDGNEGADPVRLPLVVVPGVLGAAEGFRERIADLAPRRCISVSLRGRGKSDAPQAGYSLDDHVADLEAIVGHAGLGPFALLGHSMGVVYALAYALRHPRRVRGLILSDYPAVYPSIPPEWVEQQLAAKASRQVRRHVVEGIQRDSTRVELWDRLGALECPALVLRGGQPGSLLPEDAAEMYRRHLKKVSVVLFEQSGHQTWEPDPERFVAVVRGFLEQLDPVQPAGASRQ